MKELINTLASEFADAEYAHAYMESHSVSRLAAQIYALRKQRGWSQEDLAIRSGIAQERISKIESGDFDSLTMKTLRKFSRAFDVNLQVSFGEFTKGILDIMNLNPAHLEVAPREVDLQSFASRLIKENAQGKWCAVNKTHLAVVETLNTNIPRNMETKIGRWQELPSTTLMASA